jgi:signal transduction histidine kinase
VRQASLARLLLQFGASGLVVLLIVAVGATYAFRRVGEDESVRDAGEVTALIGGSVIEPHLRDSIIHGDPKAIAELDRAVRSGVIHNPFVRVKLWTSTGRIVYSDEPRLIGAKYALDADSKKSLATGRVIAGISDLSKPENRFEQPRRKLLEVYAPVTTPSGQRLLFETYLSLKAVQASARRIWVAFAPALVLGLLLLWLVQVPLAASLTRRLREAQAEREGLLLRSLDASDNERRRIASDLHDGVVQHLAGTAFTLAGVAERAHDRDLRGVLQEAAASTRRAVRELRSLLVEIYPPNLHTAGVEAALSDLLARAAARGAATGLEVGDGVALSPEQEQLVFRTAQEALRNVTAHADAATITVTLTAADGTYELAVTDDGRGFDREQRMRQRRRAHIGLSLLEDRARDLGAELEVTSAPGAGTRITLRGPLP